MRRGCGLLSDGLLARLQFCDILSHLFLLRSKLLLLGNELLKLLLRGGKLLLLGGKLFYPAPHERKILHHHVKLLRQFRRCRRRTGR